MSDTTTEQTEEESYWQQRQMELEKLIQDRTDQTIIRVGELFNNTFKLMDKQIIEIFSKFMSDGKISAYEARKLLNERQTKDIRETLKRMYEHAESDEVKQDILNRLNAPAYASRIAKIEALKDLVYSEALMAGYEAEQLLKARMIDTYKQAYYRTTYNIQHKTGYGYDFTKLSNSAVKAALSHNWLGSNYSKRIWKNTDMLADNLEKVITSGLMSGASRRRMSDMLEACMESGRYNINRLVRTEVNYICNQGIKLSYQEAGIKKYYYIATLDLRTSEACRALDRKVFPVAEAQPGKNYPPMHPHCRSVTGAYIEGRDYSKLKRGARDPETGKWIYVPADMTYNEWYDKYVRGNAKAEAKEKAIKNRSSDKKQFESYKELLGKEIPDSVEKFQEMKYNEPEKYEQLRQKAAIRRKENNFRNRLHNGEINTNVRSVKQQEHVCGTEKWKQRVKLDFETKNTAPDMFYEDVDIQELVNKYAGTGILRFGKGQPYPIEYVSADRYIGKRFNYGLGKYENTKRFAIRYSSKGVHLHPVKEGE